MIIILLLAAVFIPSIVNSVCPPYRKDIVCIDFNQQCTTNYNCKEGNICCSVECGTACKPPYRPPYVDPKCQPVTCKMLCEFGFAKDENGCEICRCNEFPVVKPGRCPNNIDPNLVCPAFVRPGDCAGDGSCPGKRKCCRVGCFHGCVDPEPVCPPVCAIFCEFGNVMDSNGCPTCRCRDNPCPPDPPCPIPPLVPPGECPRRCRFIYKDIGGVSCKVGCEFGPAGPTRPPCLPDNCIRGHIEPPGTKNGSCPAVKPDDVVICAELCSGDDSCPGNKKCCPNGCGLVCMNPIGEHICPIIDCSVPCKHGYELDNYGCQTCICKPYRCLPPPCPPPPKDACIEPQYTIIEGVKCPACYKIVPCKGNCSKGKPLPNVICDDVNRKCPAGYRCKKIHGICCSDCAQINCPNQCEFGFVIDSDGCQTCDCKPSPCIRPPCLPPPEDACTEDEYRIIDGVKCPWCYKIVPCKDKVCPIVLPNSVCYGYTRVCKDDSSCSEGQKCCKQGCSYVCVNPV